MMKSAVFMFGKREPPAAPRDYSLANSTIVFASDIRDLQSRQEQATRPALKSICTSPPRT